jgi:D-lactate dehydrogenase
MQISMAGSRHYDQESFEQACRDRASTHQFVFAPEPLNRRTARLSHGCEAVCAFVNDELDAPTLEQLAEQAPTMSTSRRPASSGSGC